jgi:histidine triad (HIT) family protein
VDLTAGEWQALDALRPGDATARARLGDPAFRRLVSQAAEKLRLASVQGDAEPVTGFQVPRLSPCPFCEYLAGRVDADDPPVVIAEDAMSVAYVAANPLGGMPGQVLVITRRHAETILDLRPEEEAALAATVGNAARAVRAALAPPGVLVQQHNGVAAFQTVGHVHVHVVPKVPGPFPPAEPVPRLPLEERVRLAESLRGHWPALPPASR